MPRLTGLLLPALAPPPTAQQSLVLVRGCSRLATLLLRG